MTVEVVSELAEYSAEWFEVRAIAALKVAEDLPAGSAGELYMGRVATVDALLSISQRLAELLDQLRDGTPG